MQLNSIQGDLFGAEFLVVAELSTWSLDYK